jgi:hypothetical protein
MLNKESLTTGTIEKPKEQENLEAPQGIKSPEEVRVNMTSAVEKETAKFEKECAGDLLRIENQEKDGVRIDPKDKNKLKEIAQQAVTAKVELLDGIELPKKLSPESLDDFDVENLLKNYLDHIYDSKAHENFLTLCQEGKLPIEGSFEDEKTVNLMAEALRIGLMTERENAKKMTKCMKCGTEMVSSKFCPNCGELRCGFIFTEVVNSLEGIDSILKANNSSKDGGGHEKDEEAVRFRNNILFVVSEALGSSNITERIALDTWLSDHIDDIGKSKKVHKMANGNHDHIGAETFINIISKTGNKDLLEKVLEIVPDGTKHTDVEVDILDLFNKKYPPFLEQRTKEIAVFFAKKLGLGKEIVGKWEKAKVQFGTDNEGKEIFYESYSRNIKAAQRLNELKQGSPKELFDKFGIANFDRYDDQMLVHQLEAENNDVPYGVVVFPESDWIGAFFQDATMLKRVSMTLEKNNYEMRIVEAASQLGMAKYLGRLNRKYAPKGNKIDFIILGGHGSKSSVNLGEEAYPDNEPPPLPGAMTSEDDYQNALKEWQRNNVFKNDNAEKNDRKLNLQSDDIENGGGPGVRRAAREWLSDNAPVVLFSCGTGIEGGFAQKVSRELDIKTAAPEKPAHVASLDVHFDDNNKPVFDIEYKTSGGFSQPLEKVQTMEYSSGKKVTK